MSQGKWKLQITKKSYLCIYKESGAFEMKSVHFVIHLLKIGFFLNGPNNICMYNNILHMYLCQTYNYIIM